MWDHVSWPTVEQLLSMSNEELGRIDPVVANLVVAKGIPSLGEIDIGHYVGMADQWAGEIQGYLPAADANFFRNPAVWRHDLQFARLALLAWYVDDVLGIDYREDKRNLRRVLYTDPTDLFLNGVMDTRRGTCGNMGLVYVVLGWRLGWPISLACVGPHFIGRYDDGKTAYNIEATAAKNGCGLCSPPDEYYFDEYQIPQRAVACGSDLRALAPHELLAVFLGARARHLENVNCFAEAERDYLLARYLFPRNRQLFINQNQVSVTNSMDLFEPEEKGHPIELAIWLKQLVRLAPWRRKQAAQQVREPQEKKNGQSVDAALQEILAGSDC